MDQFRCRYRTPREFRERRANTTVCSDEKATSWLCGDERTDTVTPSIQSVPVRIPVPHGRSHARSATFNVSATYRQRFRRHASTLGEHGCSDENAFFRGVELRCVRWDDRTVGFKCADAEKAARHSLHVMREV